LFGWLAVNFQLWKSAFLIIIETYGNQLFAFSLRLQSLQRFFAVFKGLENDVFFVADHFGEYYSANPMLDMKESFFDAT